MKRQVYIVTYEQNSRYFTGCSYTFVVGRESLKEEINRRLALGCQNMRYFKIDKGQAVKKSFVQW